MSNTDSQISGFYSLISRSIRNAVASVRKFMAGAVRRFQLIVDGAAPIPVLEVEPSLLFDPQPRKRARKENTNG